MISYPILYDKDKISFGKLTSQSEILFLFQQIFNRTFESTILDWFDQCPTGGNLWYGAFEQDIPVGMYGLLPMKFRINNNEYFGALCNNVGVIPRLQGKGLFQSLGQYALKDSKFPIVVGIPNSKAVKGHKRIGWKSYGKLELLSGNIENIENINNHTYDAENFIFISSSNNYYFSVVKNLQWLKWRYSKPDILYKQTCFDNKEFLVWKEYQGKKQILETNNFNLIFKLNGIVDIWSLKDSSQSNYLKSQGFEVILNNEFIIYQNEYFSLDLNPDNIKFELGDNDVF